MRWKILRAPMMALTMTDSPGRVSTMSAAPRAASVAPDQVHRQACKRQQPEVRGYAPTYRRNHVDLLLYTRKHTSRATGHHLPARLEASRITARQVFWDTKKLSRAFLCTSATNSAQLQQFQGCMMRSTLLDLNTSTGQLAATTLPVAGHISF